MTPPPRRGDPDPPRVAAAPQAVSSLLPFLLFGLGRLMERELEVRLADLGLSLRTLGILGHLAASGQRSYSNLARRADVTVQTMHATVRRMTADGLVSAEGVSGQAAALSLTPLGRSRLDDATRILAAYETELLQDTHVDETGIKTALDALARGAWRLRTPTD